MTDPLSRPQSGRRISRRDLLHGASVGIVASAAAGVLPTLGYSQRPMQSGSGGAQPASGAITPASLPKGFSKDEYPRRWQRLRALMKEKNLDAVLVPAGDAGNSTSDVTYLAGRGAAWAVFTGDGKLVAIAADGSGGTKDDLGVEWHRDGRAPDAVRGNAEAGQWAAPLIDILRKNGLTSARLGVGNLSGLPRNDEGSVNYTTLDRVIKAFPQAKFESAVDVMMRLRMARTAEEIAVMEKAALVSEMGVQTMLEMARPGVSLMDLWLKMHETMLRASGESPTIAFTLSNVGGGGGGRAPRSPGSYANPHGGPPPVGQTLRAGQIFNQEVVGSVLGYAMQANLGVSIGSPAPQEWESAGKFCIEAFDRLLEFITPGKTGKELNDFWVKLLASKGMVDDGTTVVYQGGDGPRMGPQRKEGRNMVVEEGWVFHCLKPTIPMPKAGAFARFGDGVVVTAKGSRRLGKRRFEVVSLGA